MLFRKIQILFFLFFCHFSFCDDSIKFNYIKQDGTIELPPGGWENFIVSFKLFMHIASYDNYLETTEQSVFHQTRIQQLCTFFCCFKKQWALGAEEGYRANTDRWEKMKKYELFNKINPDEMNEKIRGFIGQDSQAYAAFARPISTLRVARGRGEDFKCFPAGYKKYMLETEGLNRGANALKRNYSAPSKECLS